MLFYRSEAFPATRKLIGSSPDLENAIKIRLLSGSISLYAT